MAGVEEDKDLTKSSDQIPTPFCQPCNSDGTHIDAEGYCQTCNEFLCCNCYKAHTVPRQTRHHVVLDKIQMPLDTEINQSTRPTPCTTLCNEHPDELIKIHCESHDIVVCTVCSVLKHQKPCILRYIPDIKDLSSYHTSTEFTSLVNRLETLERNINSCIEQVSNNKDKIEKKMNAIIEDFETLRRAVEEYFDKKEKELKKITEQMKVEDETLLQNLLDDLNSLKNQVEEKRTKLALLENETSNLFAASKRINKQMSEFEKMWDEYRYKNIEQHFRLKMNKAVIRSLLSKGFGVVERCCKDYPNQQEFITSLTQSPSLEFRSAAATRLPDIQAKLDDDDKDSDITGLVFLPPSTLIIVDYHNCKVKAIDTSTNTVTSQLKLDGNPWDITILQENQEVAVTRPYDKNIDVISTRCKLRQDRSIYVDANCYGICSYGENIYVSYCFPTKIEVMDLSGKVLCTIWTHTDDSNSLPYPQYLTVTEVETGTVILVSDCHSNVISKYTTEGMFITAYANSWKCPTGVICVGNNQLLVCNWGGHTVDVVSGDGEVVTLLDNKKHGIKYPHSVCYFDSEGKLYVGCIGSVYVYKLSEN